MNSTPRTCLQLRNGVRMPRIGLGTSGDARTTVASALTAGYRLFDTAFAYGNERDVGAALRGAAVPREEVFVTSKLNREDHGRREVRAALERSLAELGLDHLDLFLIHWPNPAHDRFVEAWEGLVDLLPTGLVRAIGVSNFKPGHLGRLVDETGVAPHVNQIEMNPYTPRLATRDVHAQHGIATQAWSPLGRGEGLLAEPSILEIAERRDRSPSQVVLRWHLQSGAAAIPRSGHPGRQRENLEVLDFELDAADMAALAALDRGESTAADSDVVGH